MTALVIALIELLFTRINQLFDGLVLMLSYTIAKAIPLHVETLLTDVVSIFYVSELQVFVDIKG